MMDDLIQDAARRMDKSVETTQHEFNSIRTGRASALGKNVRHGRLCASCLSGETCNEHGMIRLTLLC